MSCQSNNLRTRSRRFAISAETHLRDRSLAAPVARLVEEFHKLPGIGPKTAQRLTYYLIRMPEEESRALAEAILAVKDRIVLCSRCYNITESNPCAICDNPNRDQTSICVVEEALETLESADGIQRKGVVLATLSKLKQVCNHPAQFLGDNSATSGPQGVPVSSMRGARDRKSVV